MTDPRPTTPITKIVSGNTIYSDNFKQDHFILGWIVVDRDKMITELEVELKMGRERGLNDFAKKIFDRLSVAVVACNNEQQEIAYEYADYVVREELKSIRDGVKHD